MTAVDARPALRTDHATIRVAAIGLGQRAATMLGHLSKAESGLQLAAVVDPNRDEARRRLEQRSVRTASSIAWFDDLDAFLRDGCDVDGLVIGTRCHLHTPLAIRLAALGLPLFLEKPVAISWEQLGGLRRAFEGGDDRVVVSFPLRRTPLFEAALEIVRSGRLGPVNQVQAVNYVPYGNVYVDTWYRDYDATGGLWLQKATHDFDYIHLLAGSGPTHVTAMHSQVVWREPVKHQDAGSAIVRYADGSHAAYSQNFLSRRAAGSRGATVTGGDATLRFDWFTNRIHVFDHGRDRADTIEVKPGEGHGGGDENLARNFLDVVLGRAPSLTPLSAGLLSAATCLAARDAAFQGVTQAIPPQDAELQAGAPRGTDPGLIEPPTN